MEAMDPGLALVEVLAGCEPAYVDDAALVELVAGWERVASWAAAGQAAAVAELGRRRVGERAQFVGDEVAARLCVTRAVAE
ncbi:hypothetical protein ACQUZK_09730, partial [Streptococcus pyogenes]|uniref:hypothetical protein n=1 Tax=Streptococcus pyogenes TaxID=1314 RepID=UPI003DA1B053